MKKIIGISLLFIISLIIAATAWSWHTLYQYDSQQEKNANHQNTLNFKNAQFILLPNKLYFAGEEVPLSIQNVGERMDLELHINTYWHTNTILMIKRANRWLPIIGKELAKYNIPDDFKYLVAIESNFRNMTSPRNAVGFWQILKTTGKEKGLEITPEVDERYDPIKATHAAAKYLTHAYSKFNNWTLAAASYNRGITGMMKALRHQKENDYYSLLLNEETSRYVFRIIASKLILESPKHYGFNIDNAQLYPPFDTYSVEVTQSIPNLVDWAKNQKITYRQLKRYNPWLRTNKLTIRKGKKYTIQLPK